MAKTVVIGASSGLGRCIGVGLAQRGDQVALLARRLERIETAAQEAGSTAIAVECDVTDEDSVRSGVDAAADALGGIDNVVYSPAISPLVPLAQTNAETWRRVFDTNVIGAALATAAAVPHLSKAAGKVVYLSSDAGTFGPPWVGRELTASAKQRWKDSWKLGAPNTRTSGSPTSSLVNARVAKATHRLA